MRFLTLGIYSIIFCIYTNASIELKNDIVSVEGNGTSYCIGDYAGSNSDFEFTELGTNTIRLEDNKSGYTFRFLLTNRQNEETLLIGTLLPYLDQVKVYYRSKGEELVACQKTDDSYPLFRHYPKFCVNVFI